MSNWLYLEFVNFLLVLRLVSSSRGSGAESLDMESKRFAASIISLVAFIWFAILLELIKCNVENCLDVIIDVERITHHWFAVVQGKFFLF